MNSAPLVIRNIIKSYSGVPVLRGIDIVVEPGTFLAIAGENGAGKSTLLKIMSGMTSPDEGTVTRGGIQAKGNPSSARALGIALVPQELEPIPDMTVYENIFLAHEVATAGFLRRGEMIRRASKTMERFGLEIDPRTRVRDLSVGNIQLLEIIKAVSSGAEFILLDEPTSSLAEKEVHHLFSVLSHLRADGLSAVFTTHKMQEMRDLADRVAVLRDGKLIVEKAMTEIEDHEIVTSMIGRELGDLFPELPVPMDRVVLEVEGVSSRTNRRPIPLTVKAGEIVGLAGLVGAGRSEYLEAIFGVRGNHGGSVRVDSSPVKPGSITSAISRGMALVPEERKTAGLVLTMNVLDNATVASISQQSRFGFLYQAKRKSVFHDVMEKLNLKYRNFAQPVSTLSGGNQQKIVIGKWLIGNCRVLLLDEPTRGVDVGARSEIYQIIADLAASGAAVVMASSDMNEVIGLSHRVLVLSDGEIAGELGQMELKEPNVQEQIFMLASSLTDTADTSEVLSH